ncbi:glycosyltransferase family 2 protein [Sphingomonas panacisoli]|uniref:Glycosyltransferase family 2 protein n=1 Tax=Sphingomonas panacisoli TaxID=1813879 RepID=A0A5B8LFV9_9SPHN|nr:glycosyltransferase [Sphingomonas panacisoli]QDZ06943.1 glycosyltransferase family 2 protein [Sphingomonas panacisoli]
MKYAYVCTNYNNAHFTIDAVRTISAASFPPALIVVVDNQSAADDVQKLQTLAEAYPQVDLVLNADNVGYFPGLNIGIDRVTTLDPTIDCMIVGNNDLEFPVDLGERLAEVVADATDRPVVSPYIETLDGMPQNPHVISGISRPRELVYDLYYANYHLARLIRTVSRLTHRFMDRSDEQGFANPGFIYQGHGSCYILTPAFFTNFKHLWAPTFMMGEEYFLSRQLSERGHMTYYDPRVRIRHRCNGAIENVPARKMWGLARDAHRVYRRYVKPWHRQAHGVNRKIPSL